MVERTISIEAARELLECREDACAAEIQAAFRKKVRKLRPDLGHMSSEDYDNLQIARRTLLASAAPDRRRWKRAKDAVYKRGMRRTTWVTGAPRDEQSLETYL